MRTYPVPWLVAVLVLTALAVAIGASADPCVPFCSPP